MEPVATTHLSWVITLGLRDEEGTNRPVPGRLEYDQGEPWTVTLVIGDDECSVAWTLAREMLADGLHEPRGDGDVRVWPSLDPDGLATLLVELSTPLGEALLQADPREVAGFLAMSHEVVAPGQEAGHLDLDAVIRGLFTA